MRCRSPAGSIASRAPLLAAAVLLHLPVTAFVVVDVALLQCVAEFLVTRNYAVAMMAITRLALLLGQLADPHPVAGLLLDRG